MRAPFFSRNFKLDENKSSAYVGTYFRNGSLITLKYTEANLVSQGVASTSENINPYNTAFFLGQLTLNTSSDVWFDTLQLPDTITYDEDKAAFLAANSQIGTVWNNWQTIWTGQPIDTVISSSGIWRTSFDSSNRQFWQSVTNQTISRSVTSVQQRTGTLTTVGSTQIQTFNGNRVIDNSFIPFMRQNQMAFVGQGFMPATNLFGFFDGFDVTPYVNNLNYVQLSSNTANSFIDVSGNNEDVQIYEPQTNRVLATAKIARGRAATIALYSINNVSGNGAFITNSANVSFIRSANSARSSVANSQIQSFYHQSGNVVSATSSSVVLANNIVNATNATNAALTGKVLKIVAGTGAGQNVTIGTYTTSTKTVTVSPSFTTVPDTTSIYSIGNMASDTRGEVWGELHIPPSNVNKFRVGDKVFRIMDRSDGDLSASLTNADGKFFAQGTLTSKSNFITSTRVPVLTRSSVNEEQTFTTTTQRLQQVLGAVQYVDPLAQTFLIDQQKHPNGVFVTSVRLMVETKDSSIPLRVQIRPVVNGYPHSSQIVPFADKYVYPEDIIEVDSSTLGIRFANTSMTAPLNDSTMYTNVKFDSPIYLNPGQEYALVLQSNSFKYRVFLSRYGDLIYGTNRLISSQPYLGSLFKSQNSSTWTAVQEEDLMFQIMQAQFSSTGSVEFTLQSPPSSKIGRAHV